MRTKAEASDFVARRMLAYCLHTLRRIGSRADRPLSRSLTCRPRASLPRSCRSFGPLDSRIEGSSEALCCCVRESCVPAILSVRMHMHRSWKIMLFCASYNNNIAAGVDAWARSTEPKLCSEPCQRRSWGLSLGTDLRLGQATRSLSYLRLAHKLKGR